MDWLKIFVRPEGHHNFAGFTSSIASVSKSVTKDQNAYFGLTPIHLSMYNWRFIIADAIFRRSPHLISGFAS